MKVILAIVIHFIVPVTGLKLYLFVCQRMKDSNIEYPPFIPFFILFFTYGTFTLIVLTLCFWYWSGAASLGAAYLMLLAPILMFLLVIILFPKRKLSRYHYSAFIASAGYVVLIGFIWAGVLYLNNTNP